MEYNYKDDIINNRLGFLGASDANMIAKIDNLGSVPSSCIQRLAQLKGLYVKSDDIKTEAMANGDKIENQIFEILYAKDNRWKSNPRYESKKFKCKNLNLLTHIDYELIDVGNKIITWVECKATKYSIDVDHNTYKNQLYIENVLGREWAKSHGNDWKFNLKLCHYNTNEYNGEIDLDKIEMKKIRYNRPPFNISKAMDIIDKYLDTLTEYHEEGVVQMKIDNLPENIKNKMALCLEYWQNENKEEYKRYQEMLEAVNEFKEDLYDIMLKQNITERIDFVDLGKSFKLKKPYDTVKFDTKKFKEEHKTLSKKYSYVSNVKGSVLINDIK